MCISGVSSLQIAAACFLLVCATLAISRRGRSKRRFGLPLPPGPPGEFILGHLRSIPKSDTALAYAKWGREYSWFGGGPTPFPQLTVKSTGSDVIYLESLGQPIVVLNSTEAAAELLSRRAANYSDRPRFTLFDVYAPISPSQDLRPVQISILNGARDMLTTRLKIKHGVGCDIDVPPFRAPMAPAPETFANEPQPLQGPPVAEAADPRVSACRHVHPSRRKHLETSAKEVGAICLQAH